ncbi:MAG: tetratricopeptide repeat protein [Candidatus Bathyarchaeota archaeon]|nr:tetratricopeptide repeat protein [Candidatus Bathyarchaeota archaeon]MDW8040543.1 tetratricopeptide repeat protein [Nitrososphaerota archaeon]
MAEKEDPVKLHKDGNTLYELGKYEEAKENFLRASELYLKANNFFDASYSLFKAGECAFMLKAYDKAIEYFQKSADLSFNKGFERFGVTALEYARDCYKALAQKEKVAELEKKIKEIKARLEESF